MMQTLTEWATIVEAGATVVGLLFIYLSLRKTAESNRLAVKAYQSEIKPFLTTEIENAEHSGYFSHVKAQNKEVWMRINNAGKSPAIVDLIYRRWTVVPRGTYAGIIDPTDHSKLSEGLKHISIPIGASSKSGLMRTRMTEFLEVEALKNNWVFFDGFIEFHDLEGNNYRSGFSFLIDQGKVHLALPKINAEKYNYQIELPTVG